MSFIDAKDALCTPLATVRHKLPSEATGTLMLLLLLCEPEP